ncbi:MAG: sulfotransferase domain-containing protein, partial [Cyclobacteriaceae bacterium]
MKKLSSKHPLDKMEASLKRFIKESINRIPAAYRYFQGKEKNILLFSSRRGGSSILAQLLSANPFIREIDQPFDINLKNDVESSTKIKRLPSKMHSQFLSLNEEEKQIVENYISRLLKGEIPEIKKYIIANRTVLKIVNAFPLMDYLADLTKADIIYLSRHPVAQSLSVIQNKWEFTSEAFLADPVFAGNYLTQLQIDLGHDVIRQGTLLEKGVLNWCLENLYPLKFCKSEMLHITYEDLILNKEPVLQMMNEKLRISKVEKLHRILSKPSRSSYLSDKSSVEAISKGNSNALVQKWIPRLHENEKKAVQKILDVFEINLYNAYDALP